MIRERSKWERRVSGREEDTEKEIDNVFLKIDRIEFLLSVVYIYTVYVSTADGINRERKEKILFT